MRQIIVDVQNKIATPQGNALYVCGNSDYVIRFSFDAEWDGLEAKTARFEYDGKYQEVVFAGDECRVPIISNVYNFNVGVYAGDLRTTTPAYIPAKKSILCNGGVHVEPEPDVYNQIIELVNKACVASAEAVKQTGESAAAAKESETNAYTSAEEAIQAAERAEKSETAAKASENATAEDAQIALLSAERAEMAASQAGWFDMEVNEAGHLIYTRSDNVDEIEFELDAGRLIVNYG